MKRARQQRGGTLLESAIVFLLLFSLLLAILEFGRAYNIYQVITDAAREGARFAVAPCSLNNGPCPFGALGSTPSTSDVQNVVNNYLRAGHVKGTTVTVTQVTQPLNGLDTNFTQVQVQAPYTFIFFPYGALNLTTRAVMRNEFN